MMQKYYLYTLITAFAFFGLFACDDDSSTSPVLDDPTITEIAADDENFSILVDVLIEAGLASTLDAEGEFTVFAPTNQAFENLPAGLLEELTEEQLTDILTYHVLESEVPSEVLQPEQTVETLSGESIFVTVSGSSVLVNGSSSVVTADISASNGFIHAVDEVLLPDAFGTIADNAQKRYFLTMLVDALVQTDLVTAVADPDAELTVFAPSNAAFEEIADIVESLSPEELTEVLLYHVIEGRVLSGDLAPEQTVQTLGGEEITIVVENGSVVINGSATVTTADQDGTNGVIHVIDAVLIP